jgi:hypothetical protein
MKLAGGVTRSKVTPPPAAVSSSQRYNSLQLIQKPDAAVEASPDPGMGLPL